MSEAYARSPGHAHGEDLQILLNMLHPSGQMHVLDVATGPGHTAIAVAPSVEHVVAGDISAEMIDAAQVLAEEHKLANISFVILEAEQLPFKDCQFDAVTCRIAPHHFLDIITAVKEANRVLRPDGRFLLEDSLSPNNRVFDEFINTVERMRDPTHVRSYSEPEWMAMLQAAGFHVMERAVFRKKHLIPEWIERAGADSRTRERVMEAFASAPPSAREYFEIGFDQSRDASYTDDKVLIRAYKG